MTELTLYLKTLDLYFLFSFVTTELTDVESSSVYNFALPPSAGCKVQATNLIASMKQEWCLKRENNTICSPFLRKVVNYKNNSRLVGRMILGSKACTQLGTNPKHFLQVVLKICHRDLSD